MISETRLNPKTNQQSGFACPDCKADLDELFCSSCQHQFTTKDGIPILLSRESSLRVGESIGAVYDQIYSSRSDVWEDQGRTPELHAYLADLIGSYSTGTVLEVGCGEGLLLNVVNAKQKFAVDVSAEVLKKARRLTNGTCAVAVAERLPFSDCKFDVVFSIGVMEHFIDDLAANEEILRVLRPGGHYLALIHVNRSLSERIQQKIREFIFPRPRPVQFLRWIANRLHIDQPISRGYTTESARSCIENAGLRVTKIISKRESPEAPLVAPYVRIYLAERPNPDITVS